ncbi:MAG: 30S ribosomal protein S18 [Candidatus Marinimicrobia bacterium]|nr:30S ribosomal protein S18 [Candidatus Neomarinimicrobiota bacterium]
MTFVSKKKFCFFKENGITEVDYKDVKLLRRFITEQGKIMPRRVTGSTAKMHRKLVHAIKRARNIALIPYTNSSMDS